LTRSVIKLRRESSDRFALGKNRDMGCQHVTRSVRLRSIFCSQDWFLEFVQRREAEQISASISVRWEPDGIFADHTPELSHSIKKLGIRMTVAQLFRNIPSDGC
jgi:hypothetical protein